MDGTERSEQARLRTSRQAIAALVLAILTFVLLFLPVPGGWALLASPLCGILAIGYGTAGLIAVERSGGKLAGRRQAITGIVLPAIVNRGKGN